MYNAQITIDRIQNLIKSRKLVQKTVLEDCGLNENTLKRMNDSRGMSSFNLAKIADYLDVSVDYLLGRTDEPEIHGISNVISIGGNNAGSLSNSINIGKASTEDIDEIVEMLKELTLTQRSKVVLMIDELKNQK